MNRVLQLLLTILFNDVKPMSIIFNALYMIGLFKVLDKSGINGWWAFIPGMRNYQLARCAGREPEGRVIFVTEITITMLNVLELYFSINAEQHLFLSLFLIVIEISFVFTHFIYMIRVFLGLCEVYNIRKRWVWLCILEETRWIPMLVWGFINKYVPSWQVEDMKAEMERLATYGRASVMDEGLTVNLDTRTVREFFQKKTLLRDIHMAIPQGHLVLLLGGSGAGKTTYLNAINGYEKAKAEVMLNGTNMYTQYKQMQYEVGFVPQTEMMRGKDTVLNTLLDAAKLRLPKDVSTPQRRQRVDEVMEIFGLKPVKDNLVEKLSGGQKKRLSISMEFISNPSLFILDEPDSGLDGVMARELFVQLRKIADSGKIVIVITHTPDRVIDLFDDVIVLAKDSTRTGRLAFYGSIDEARAFFGRERMEEIVKSVNRQEEGGDGLADDFILKYGEVHHG